MNVSAKLGAEDLAQPLRFTVPEELHEIDLTEDAETRVQRAYANATAIMRGATEMQRLSVVFNREMMIAQLVSEGAVYAGQLIARSDADATKLATAQFAILVKEADLDAADPLAAVAGGLKEPGKAREVGFAQYPAGAALVVGEEVKVTMPVTVTGEPVASTSLVRQAQIVFPCPDRRHIVILTVSSDSLADWRAYVDILDGMARSVSFRASKTSPIADRLSGF
jgi:ribosomal protein L18